MGALTIDPRIRAIEAKRKALRVSNSALCARAGADLRHWNRLRKGDGIRLNKTVERFDRALAELAIGAPRARPPAVIAAFVRAAELIVLHEVAGRKKLIAALTFERTRRSRAQPEAIAASRLRRLAIYLVAVELEVSNAKLARALNTTRQKRAAGAQRDRGPARTTRGRRTARALSGAIERGELCRMKI